METLDKPDDLDRIPANGRTIGFKWGMISSVIHIVLFLILVFAGLNAFDNKFGWVNLVISVALLVLAHREFKQDGDGFMNYGEGFGVGLWMTLISIVVGFVFTYVYVSFLDTGVMQLMLDKQAEEMQAKNMADEQIEMAMTWTKKLFWPIYLIFGSLFSVIMIAIVSIFTQKRRPESRF